MINILDSYVHPQGDDVRSPAVAHAWAGEQKELIDRIASGTATAATLSQPDDRGYTVLHEMAHRRRSVKAMLHAAIATGMDLNVQDRHGQTALHHAAAMNNLVVMRALTKAGAALNLLDRQRHTPFQVAYRSVREGAVRLLIKAGADLSSRNLDDERAIDHVPSPIDAPRLNVLRNETVQAMVQREQNVLRNVMAGELTTVTPPCDRVTPAVRRPRL